MVRRGVSTLRPLWAYPLEVGSVLGSLGYQLISARSQYPDTIHNRVGCEASGYCLLGSRFSGERMKPFALFCTIFSFRQEEHQENQRPLGKDLS